MKAVSLCLCLCCFLLMCPSGLVAQGAYLDKGVNGVGAELRAAWTLEGFAGLGVMSGYSIGGVLDIGADLDFSLGELYGNETSDLRLAFVYSVNLLKQSGNVPVSLQVQGSYGVSNVISRYLEDDGAARRGQGYTIGVALSRSFRLSSLALVRLNVLADYQSVTFATIGGATIPDSTDYGRNLYFGGAIGLVFELQSGAVLGVHGELRSNQNYDLWARPILAVAFPAN